MTRHHTKHGTFLGFDFGMKRIGIAVGQSITQSARPLAILKAKEGIPAWLEVTRLITTFRPIALIVGMPLNMDGTTQPIAKHAHRFAQHLRTQYALPVYENDERLTTKSAREQIFLQGGYHALNHQPIDSVAAQLILEAWLREKM